MKNLLSKKNLTDEELELQKNKKKAKAAARTAQRSIRYQNMFEDGLCEIEPGLYSFEIKFDDINYQIAKKNDQIEIFTRYCEFLNYFDKNSHLQLNIRCKSVDEDSLKNNLTIPAQDDNLNEYRNEFSNEILNKSLTGQNGIARDKYLIISFEAENIDDAKSLCNRLKNDVHSNFKSMRCNAYDCSGLQRVYQLREYFSENSDTYWNYGNLKNSGTKTIDYISPDSFNFRPNNYFTFTNNGKTTYAATIYLKNLPRDLSDRILTNISELPIEDMTISIHMDPLEQDEAFGIVESQLAKMDIERSNIEDKNVANNRPPERIPLKLKKNIAEAQEVYDSLSNDNQRMFMFSAYVYATGTTEKELDTNLQQIIKCARKSNVEFSYLSERQEEGFNAILPIGKNPLEIKRTLTTSGTAIFIPFTTQEMLQLSGVYYGVNSLSSKLLMIDRSLMMNPNGFFLGVPGSGKSFLAKLEIIQNFLRFTNDDIIIIDPEREYSAMAKALGGQVIYISSSSNTHINPMDMSENYSAGEGNPIALKSDFILSLCEMLIGGKNGLGEGQRSVLDRSVILTYKKFKKPTLKDFYSVLVAQPEPEARSAALSLEMYIKGSLSIFSHETNINTNNRLIVFDTMELGEQLKPMGLLITQDMVWNKISENRAKSKRTWFYIDEAHLMFKDEYSAQYCDKIWKRARKWGAIPSGITQNIEGMLASDQTRQMLANCEFLCLMNQSAIDRAQISSLLDMSDAQLTYITNAKQGSGVIRAGSTIIPFKNDFDKDTKLYKLMSTKFKERISDTEEEARETVS